MKKITFVLLLFILPVSLFCQNISIDILKSKYEDLITFSNLENLRIFSTTLDLFSQSKDYNSLKKHSDYQQSFSDLNNTTKRTLGRFENPWDETLNTDFVSTKYIDENFYYFILLHNKYVTKRSITYRVLASISITIVFFTLIMLILFLNYQKEKQKNLIFTKALITGQETERKRISEELHDTIAQNLKAQKFLVLTYLEKNKESNELQQDLNELLKKTKTNISEIRTICQNLFPPDFENQKLDWIIAELCENIKTNFGIPCTYFVDNESPFIKFQLDQKLHLFRIIQEAVNNAALHSNCTLIQIFVTKKEVIIEDNGKGFNVNLTQKEQIKHFGIRSMQERSNLLNINLEIKSHKDGTKISLKLKKNPAEYIHTQQEKMLKNLLGEKISD